MPNTKIISFLTYKSLFLNIEKNGILIPTSYLKDFNNTRSLVEHTIKDFDITDTVSYTSFLNTIVQICDAEESEKLGLNEIAMTKLVRDAPKSGILFHRDNLLFMIEKAICKEKGFLKVTSQKTNDIAREYYKALLLISEIVPSKSFEKDYLIRAYPYYYIPRTAETIYELRLQRYWYIYNNVLNNLSNLKKNHLLTGIKEIEKKANLSLREYFQVVVMIYYWFLKIPNLRRKNEGHEKFDNLGFNYQNINSFYIKKASFGENHNLIKLVSHLALGDEKFKESFESNHGRKDKIEGFYKNFQTFFDHPIFKINSDNFCLIDLKFLIEGLCSGFVWRINAFSGSELQSIKEQYGYLLEIYFIELLKKIFGENNVLKPEEHGSPDAILETDGTVIILEFTTEYYRFASLYSENTSLLKEDLKRILFNNTSNNAVRFKKDKGKFIKLNNYVEKYKYSRKTIIPVLITENYLGDFDLLNRFDGFISNEIDYNHLENLKKYPPIILNLDDFEIFWQIANYEDTINQFACCVSRWEENRKEKGGYHFNFSFFVSEINKNSKVNKEFSKFFNFQSFMKNLGSF
jgi:hypothetical protein